MNNYAQLKYKRWDLFNSQLLRAWDEYMAKTNLIGKTQVFKKHKWFKTIFEEKILSDTWLECSYDIIDKNNVITKFSDLRIRDFHEFDSFTKNLQKSILTKPENVIANFKIECKTNYIEDFKEAQIN